MKLFSGFIFYCLLLSTVCNASEKKTGWSFPIATALGLKSSSQPKKCLPQNNSNEWTDVNHDEAPITQASESPDFVIIESDQKSPSITKPTTSSSDQSTQNPLQQNQSGIDYVDAMLQNLTIHPKITKEKPRRLSQELIDGSNIKLTPILTKALSTKKLSEENQSSTPSTNLTIPSSYQSMEIENEHKSEICNIRSISKEDVSFFDILKIICCPCFPRDIEENPVDSKKKSNQ